MNSEHAPRDRAAEFRQALVATANLGPYVRRRPPLKLVIGSLAAFALAGALTGGALATVTRPDPGTLASQAGVAGAGEQMTTQQDGTLIGAPFVRSGSGTIAIDVGKRPAGATGLMEGFECTDPGTFVIQIDTRTVETETCSATDAPSDSSGELGVQGNGDHLYTATASGSARFSVWLSWVHIPRFAPSAAEKGELSDGVVTRDEDVAAFNRYEGCMGAFGHPIDVPPTAVVPSYSVDDSAANDGSDNRCYATEYAAVDSAWQLEVEAGTQGVASIDACLTEANLVPAATPKARLVQLRAARLDPTSCAWVG
jgi:hypothetical protein